jgi:hypothetical protein
MHSPIKHVAAAAALMLLAIPAFAQDAEPEEPRTTYQISFIKLADGADDRWMEILNEHSNPAREAAGLPLSTVHWLVNGRWDLMVVTRMPDGMGQLDAHAPRTGVAFQNALRTRMGSQEAVDALNKEIDGLVEDSDRMFSHTHP